MRDRLFIIGIGSLTGLKLAYVAKNRFDIFGSYNLRDPKLDFINSLQLDITNLDNLRETLIKIKPEVIINSSALNNVDYCETHKQEAYDINFRVVEAISNLSNTIGAKLVHLSTDSVFDGTKEKPYNETDNPNPINVYGSSKLKGEQSVLNYSTNLVVRASVLYGWLPKYLASLPSSSMKPINYVQWLINKLISKDEVRVDDFTPIISLLVLTYRDKVFLFSK